MGRMTSATAIIMACAITSGCAMGLPSKEVRTVQFIEQTKAKKREAYSRALAFLSKSFRDSHSAIKMQDPEAAQIVAKGNVVCNVFRQFGDINNYNLSFDIDMQAKDGKVRMLFEDLQIVSEDGRATTWAYNQLTDTSKVEKAKECLGPIKDGLAKAIGAPASW